MVCRKKLFLISICLVVALVFPRRSFIDPSRSLASDYLRMFEFMQIDTNQEKPLFVFSGFQHNRDENRIRPFLEYLYEDPELIKTIQEDLDGYELEWKIDHSHHRLLFVPETRSEYARLFERYCSDVIAYVLKTTRLPNPYLKIETLLQERPEIREKGISVFLVHNLVEEASTDFIFSNQKDDSLRIGLNSRTLWVSWAPIRPISTPEERGACNSKRNNTLSGKPGPGILTPY